MRTVRTSVLILTAIIACPMSAFAQAAIAGVVRDTSGAILPGVTVEAASPALIEKTRAVVTDGSGQYRIVDLRPGTYTVTFTLTGFNSVRREGIELTGSFVATVNADLRVGSLAETITVSGESPIVDVKNTQSEARIDDEVLASIPTGRQYFSLAALVPGVSTMGTDVGGSAGPAFSVFRTRGGSSDEGQLQVNGFPVGWQGYGISYYVADLGAAEEVIFGLAGGMGEARTAGPTMNVVPRSGGNLFHGSFYANGAGGAMEGSNFTQAHRDAGLRAPNQLDKIWDVNANYGGPIRRDRLWFYTSARHQGNRKTVAGLWANKNAGDASKWTYDPDLSKQATDTGTWKNAATRFTYQATPRDRFSLFWDEQSICRLCLGGEGIGNPPSAPEAAPTNQGFPQRHAQATWTSPFTNRWLGEAGVALNTVQWGGVPKEPQDTSDLIRVVEQAGSIPGLTYRSTNWTRPYGYTWTWRGSLQYVTGTNSAKVGYEGNDYWNRQMNYTNRQLLAYQFNNGVPNRLTMTLASPIVSAAYTHDYSLYGQDQWTRGRLSVQGGVRFEHITSGFPELTVGPSRFLSQAIVYPAQKSGVHLNDIAPRMGVAYDLFGTGKTAFKATLGRYTAEPSGSNYYANNYSPINRLQTSTNRAWGDSNGNFVADCDLLNPLVNGECGAWSNRNFGRDAFETRYDPEVLSGWNKRLQTWDLSAGVRHEILPRVGVELDYVHRIFGNFRVNDNLAVGPQDFDAFTMTVPTDSRLPTSGQQLTFVDVKPEKFGLVDNFVTFSDKYGKQTRHYNGVALTINTRLTNGFTAQGGFSGGRTVEDNCDLAAQLPEVFTVGNGILGNGAIVAPGGQVSRQFCHVRNPFNPNFSGLAAYTIPKVSVQVSGTFASKPLTDSRNTNFNAVNAESLDANLVMSNAQVAPLLGRNLAGNAANTTVNLVQPGTFYGDRITTVDLRVARIQKLGTRRLMVGVDIYNVTNSSPIVTYTEAYGPRWLLPTSILQARFAKLSAQIDF
jgi:hypothetical protein